MKRIFLLIVAEIGLTLALAGCRESESETPDISASASALAASKPSVPVGNSLLRKSITELESQKWVSARLRFRLQLFGRNIQGEGRYLQGPQMKMRLELKTLFSQQDEPATLLQVYDGNVFWEYRDVLGERQLTKISSPQVFAAIRQAQETASPKAQFLGLGGLPQLLRTLEAEFAFEQPSSITQQGRGVAQMLGRWKPRHLRALLLPADQQHLNPNKLPWHIPNQVQVQLDQQTLFPQSIRYLRTIPGKVGEMPHDANVQGEKIFVEFFRVQFDEPIADGAFFYQPSGEVLVVDKTDEYLNRLGF